MISDNGPQFASEEIHEFSAYGFRHTTSPYYPQANGLAERAVRTVKRLLQYSADPYKALLNYRATPLPWCSLSPAELLIRRKIRMEITKNLIPRWLHIENFRTLDEQWKRSQKDQYDKRHRQEHCQVCLMTSLYGLRQTRGQHIPGTVLHPANTPRSYVVETPSGEVRRNRTHLRFRTDTPDIHGETLADERSSTVSHRPVTCSQIGTNIRPLDCLRY